MITSSIHPSFASRPWTSSSPVGDGWQIVLLLNSYQTISIDLDFASLLTVKKLTSGGGGRREETPQTATATATGRFSFHKRHLYFSLIIIPNPNPNSNVGGGGGGLPPPPRYLQFLSEDGNILEEHELTTNDYYNATGKVILSLSSFSLFSSSSSLAVVSNITIAYCLLLL